jgi:Asp-tRNA(Asn)/Glu-tRNA(Gln) amidotransferase A subunit family amidase
VFQGEPLSLLDGVPVTIKDEIDVKGLHCLPCGYMNLTLKAIKLLSELHSLANCLA